MSNWFLKRSVLEQPRIPTFSMAWSPDGSLLALGGLHGELFLMDTTGERVGWTNLESGSIGSLAWSPDGKILAAGSDDKTICLWDIASRKLIRRLQGHYNTVVALAWSQDGKYLASGSLDWQIYLWDPSKYTHSLLRRLDNTINCLQWSPGGEVLAAGSGDKTIRLWNVADGKALGVFSGREWISSLAWSPAGDMIAAGTGAGTVDIWNPYKQEQIRLLEGHTGRILSVAFSADGEIFASKSADNSVKIWRCDTWEEAASFKEPGNCLYGVVFHPDKPLLVSRNDAEHQISFWQLDPDFLSHQDKPSMSTYYANAKVVLVGDSGVGKTGLGLVLSGHEWKPTESSHKRHIWTLFREKARKIEGPKKESKVEREALLWDLAGQPGYRIVHQLSLTDVSVALVVFDARSETDPFSGVAHWHVALDQARKAGSAEGVTLKKLLVAARIDRGGVAASRDRIERVVEKYGFDGYFETSAKEGLGIGELSATIKQAINWESLPIQSSNELFQEIKSFLLQKKKENWVILSKDELYRLFVSETRSEAFKQPASIEAEFAACIRLVEGGGLIRRLGFGNLVLMQPELLDAYAFRLVNAARKQPDGLGCIPEQDARTGNYIPKNERIANPDQEKLLLIAMVEDLLRHEIGLREQADLVFPSQFRRESPELPEPVGREVVFRFSGPVTNIYATLVVRLAHSQMFTLHSEDMWRNAAIFSSAVGGRYGLALTGDIDEGWAELSLFFQDVADEGLKIQFEEFVNAHLSRRASEGTIHRRWIVGCRTCGTLMTDQIVKAAKERGRREIQCPVCEALIPLDRARRRLSGEVEAEVVKMEQKANEGRDRGAALAQLPGKEATNDFDVFLCYNRQDAPAVIEIGEQLRENGLLPWLDLWNVRPGFSWQEELEKQIKNVRSVAVFVGHSGQGPWQHQEIKAFLRRFVEEKRKDREFPVIPVILRECTSPPDLPTLLQGNRWVDFRDNQSNPINELIWGITGQQNEPALFYAAPSAWRGGRGGR
jgi:WD40 repeat protein